MTTSKVTLMIDIAVVIVASMSEVYNQCIGELLLAKRGTFTGRSLRFLIGLMVGGLGYTGCRC